MSAHEDLARQLADSVAARRRAHRALATLALRRWWRGHLGASALATALCGALTVLALGAAGSGRRTGVGPALGRFAAAAETGEAACPPCRAVAGRLHAPLSGEAIASAGRPGGRREVLVRRGLPAVVWGGQRG